MAILFPGQGSQYVGMGKELYEEFTVAKQTFEEVNEILGYNLKKLCFEGTEKEITRTENAQPAILTTSVAAFRVYMQEIGIKPDYFAGHSLGEISALTCSGAIKFSDAVEIVHKRGKFMKEAVSGMDGSMAAIIGDNIKRIEKECEGTSVVIANYNSPKQTVISGRIEEVNEVCKKLCKRGFDTKKLKVSGPFHSPLMESASSKFKQELKKYEYGQMSRPVISNVTALPYKNFAEIPKVLAAQIIKPVKWKSSMNYLSECGVTTAIEIGPKKILKKLSKKNKVSIKGISYNKKTDCEKVKSILYPNHKDKIKLITKCLAVAVCTPNRNWDNDEYTTGAIEPYKKIKKMKERLEKKDKEPTLEEMKKAIKMLFSVFATKKVPLKERIERFEQIFKETKTNYIFRDFKEKVKNDSLEVEGL